MLAWDAPGCGKSDDPPERWRLPQFADDAAAWLAAIGVEHAHVLGLSWGSSVALELYRRHPEVPASLVLAGAYAGWAGSLSPEEVADRLESVLAVADLPRDDLLGAWPGLVSENAPAELVDELIAIVWDNTGVAHPVGYRAIAHSLAEADLRDVLPAIAVPTLLLYGDLDVRSPPLSVGQDLHARIPSSQLVVIPGAGHESNLEAPEQFNAEVRGFLSNRPFGR